MVAIQNFTQIYFISYLPDLLNMFSNLGRTGLTETHLENIYFHKVLAKGKYEPVDNVLLLPIINYHPTKNNHSNSRIRTISWKSSPNRRIFTITKQVTVIATLIATPKH